MVTMVRLVSKRFYSVPSSADVVKRVTTNQVFVKQGTGGRSSVSGHTATVFGATGFLGRYLVNSLGQQGTRVVVPFRGLDDDKRHLKLMGDLGQVVPLRFDLRNEDQMVQCLRHSDVVYNLIGRHYETKNFTFEKVNVEGARKVAKLCREMGVSKLVHVSALNADVNSPSTYLKTKALGEKAVLEEFPDATIVRTSAMYGDEDRFWNRLGFYSSVVGYIPLLNGGVQTLRPLYVGDVAAILSSFVRDDRAVGKVVELAGPKEYHFHRLVDLWRDTSKRDVKSITVPKALLKLGASFFDRISAFPMISPDEVERMAVSDKLSSSSLKFQDFNYEPREVEDLIIRFVRFYRPLELQRVPIEKSAKSYAIENSA